LDRCQFQVDRGLAFFRYRLLNQFLLSLNRPDEPDEGGNPRAGSNLNRLDKETIMADTTTITDSERWTSAKFNNSVAAAAWEAVREQPNCAARTQVANVALAARDILYSTSAPSLEAVAEKISTWFGEALFNDDFEMLCHCRVTGDLRRIARQAAGLDEFEASGRSHEKAALDAVEWRETLANYKEEELLYLEGPSPRWGVRDAADILAVKDYLKGVLLELPAPNVAGVIFKLEMLWEQHSFQTDSGGAFLVELKRDLNSLIPWVEAEILRED
jgi:hypothetical protein